MLIRRRGRKTLTSSTGCIADDRRAIKFGPWAVFKLALTASIPGSRRQIRMVPRAAFVRALRLVICIHHSAQAPEALRSAHGKTKAHGRQIDVSANLSDRKEVNPEQLTAPTCTTFVWFNERR